MGSGRRREGGGGSDGDGDGLRDDDDDGLGARAETTTGSGAATATGSGRAPPTLYNLLPTHAASFSPPTTSNPSPNPKPTGAPDFAHLKVFIKLVNFTHLVPTRYTLDVDLEEVASGAPDSLHTKDKKLTAAKSAKAKLKERFKIGKNRWFFTKLCMIRHDSRNANKIYSSHDSS
ncbi:60S ribosomal protein L27-3 [Hordeum vulgare]|nr:60S ribosomal protein L27-3 [Hordeum vulgare]